jgi:phospholipid-transporting ATPase
LIGLQAVHSADYAIAQFRYLTRLLLVHGSWSLSRLCKLILYSFYKNIALYVIELWFASVSAWSGQAVFERWTIGLYNVIFTAAPPLAFGLFDRQCSAEIMIKHPALYQSHSETFNVKLFWIWIGSAIWHSLVLFWLTDFAIDHDTLWQHGKADGGYLVFGRH